MYQAGIKNITLYENKGIDFRFYDPGNLSAITDLSSLGSVLEIENIQRPEFDIKLAFSKGGNATQEFSLKFLFLELSSENIELLNLIKSSIYGWCFLVEFYDGSFRFFETPLYCREASINPHQSMSFEVKLKSAVPTTKSYYNYDPDVSVVTVYRLDTTLLSFDTEVYSWDYEL